ncbi:MAG: hypothetical protein CMJ32_01545 [Phycisphaerae bacterium]|nr:hypothetical protein [Phycisphaerae bacterium]
MHASSMRITALMATGLMAIAGELHAQHAGDIAIRVVDQQLEVYGPIGEEVDTEGVYLGTFGDTGFPDFTSNPGFDAIPGTLPEGRIGFTVLDGLRRWDAQSGDWLEATEVDEKLRIWFITLETIVEDAPIAGFDLAVQPDGGWHRHFNFLLLGDGKNDPAAGVYRLDLALYSTMGLQQSNPFTILFDQEADPDDVSAAIDSMYEDSPCTGDLDGNGIVDGGDLALLLAAWSTIDSLADLSRDGVVDGQDLAILLGLWGPCPG